MNALPETLHETVEVIADACGEDVAIALIEQFAGQRLYVPGPDRITADHEIAEGIGLDAARRLAEHFAGNRIAVPKALGPQENPTRARVLTLARQGLKVRQIASQSRVTEVRVYQILASERKRTGRNPRQDPRQIEMFG